MESMPVWLQNVMEVSPARHFVSFSQAVLYRGAGLAPAEALTIHPWEPGPIDDPTSWRLLGTVSNLRYATRDEVAGLRARQEGLDRRQATHAALIPIKKSAAWWDLAQDDRRAIFEETSQHTAILSVTTVTEVPCGFSGNAADCNTDFTSSLDVSGDGYANHEQKVAAWFGID